MGVWREYVRECVTENNDEQPSSQCGLAREKREKLPTTSSERGSHVARYNPCWAQLEQFQMHANGKNPPYRKCTLPWACQHQFPRLSSRHLTVLVSDLSPSLIGLIGLKAYTERILEVRKTHSRSSRW